MKRHYITYVILTAWLLGSAQLWTSCSAVDDEPDSSRKAVLLTASSGDTQSVYGSMRSVDGLYESTTGFDGGEQVQLYLHNSAYPSVIVSGTYNVGAPDVTYKKSGLSTPQPPSHGHRQPTRTMPVTCSSTTSWRN